MNSNYQKPALKIEIFEVEDIITASAPFPVEDFEKLDIDAEEEDN